MKNVIARISITILAAACAASAGVSFSAVADRTTLAAGDRVTVVATLSSPKTVQGIPQAAQSDAFDVLGVSSGQSQSHNISMVNGQLQQTREYVYRYIYTIASKTDEAFTFPALTVSIDGSEYSTRPIRFNSGGAPQQQQNQNQNQQQQQRGSDIVVTLTPSKKTLYAGEQAILTFRVAHKANSPIQTQRGYNGAVEQIGKAFGKEFSLNPLFTNQVTQGQERIGGDLYNTFTLRYSLFGLTAGTYTIPGITFEYDEIQRGARRAANPFFSDFFDMDFFGGTQALRRATRTAPFEITVKPLSGAAPAGFAGSVGRFSLTASVEPQTVPAGESVTLKITLRGNTRASNIGDPVLPELKNCDVFTPERHISIDTTAEGLVTRKTYRYLIIPKREGVVSLGPVTYPYFDPQSGAYRTAATDSLRVTVTKGAGGPREQTRYLTQEEIRQVGHDIRYIKTGVRIADEPARPYRAPHWYLLFPLPFLIFVSALVYKLQSRQSGENKIKNIRQKALANAVKELNKAGKGGSDREFLGKAALAIEKYISNKLGFPATGRTLEELKDELLKRDIDEKTVTGLTSLIENIDAYRFGGKSFNPQRRNEIVERTITFLSSMEKTVQKKGKSTSSISAVSQALAGLAGLQLTIFAALRTIMASAAVTAIAAALLPAAAAANEMAPIEIEMPALPDDDLSSGENPAPAPRSGGANAMFQRANEFYAASEYDSARVYYERIAEAGVSSAALFYNLGNAHYRLSQPGLARLYYEKAAILSPADPDIEANIKFIKSVIVDKSDDISADPDFLTAVFYSIHTLLPLKTQLTILSALLFALSILGSAMLFKRGLARLWLGYGAALCLLLIIVIGTSAGYKIYALESKQYAIILTESLDAKNQPGGDQTLFTAHEGTKLQIRKTSGEWSLVSLPNGASGWVITSSLGKI